MAGHSSDFTSPADHLLRTTEMEAVVLDLRNKVKDLSQPEGPDGVALARNYDITFKGSKTNNASADPYAETIYDVHNSSVSMGVFGVIDSSMATRMEALLTGRPLIDAVFPTDDNRWFETSMTLSTVLLGTGDYATRIYSASTSFAGIVFGSGAMMSALIDAGSLAGTILKTPSYVSALGSRALVDTLFGSSSRLSNWANGLNNLAAASFGNTVPSITTNPLIDQIADLRAEVESLKARVTALGG